MTVVLNTPSCHSCAGDTPASAGLAPYYSVDAGRLTLVAGVAHTVTFTNIKAGNSAEWVMPKAKCLNSSKEEIYPTITESATGFSVVADQDCTFEYFCIKI